jgi:hypothetical protein
MTGSPLLTHAFGERYDSPVPLSLFVLGGAFVVLASFVLVSRREVDDGSGVAPAIEPFPPVPRGSAAVVGGGLSVAVLALLVTAGLIGSQEVPENILPTSFWLVAWVVMPLLVGLLGDFTRSMNPFAAVARAADSPRLRRLLINRRALAWPRRLGYWVAVALYLLVVVGELIVNTTATLPRVTAVGLLGYTVLCAFGGLVFGAQAWNARAELFSVLFATWGKLGWFRFGQVGRNGFAGGLDQPFEPTPSRVVGVLLLLVSVSFDGLLATPQWSRFSTGLPTGLEPGSLGGQAMSLLTLVALTGLMLAVFGGFAAAAGRAARHLGSGLSALTGLLPSLLPIAYGYLLAHYLQYVLVNGQLLFPLLGNPLGRNTSLLPYPFNDSYVVNTRIMPTSVVWYVQIVVIVGAHVVAVVLAHRHLHLRSSGPLLARRAEWPWLVAMVGYTMVSLWLLAQPLAAEHPADSQAHAVGSVVLHVVPRSASAA